MYFLVGIPSYIFKLKKARDTVYFLSVVILVFKTRNKMTLALLTISGQQLP